MTAIELMPVADFPGRWNWGYDGVALFAPSRAYGRPDDLRRLVDAAHRHDLGCCSTSSTTTSDLTATTCGVYSADYFTDRHQTPWGDGINYDGPNSRFVRDFVIENADRSGFATTTSTDCGSTRPTRSSDDSELHILAEFQQKRAREPRPAKPIVLIAEDVAQHASARSSRSSRAGWARRASGRTTSTTRCAST